MPKVRRTIRVDDTDWEQWEAASKRVGLPLSEWIRRQCNLDFFKQAVENTAKHFGVESERGNGENGDSKIVRKPRSVPVVEERAIAARGPCSHAYEFGKCPFPNCENYKWGK